MTKSNDTEIKDTILKNRPNIAQSTLKTYMSSIRNVAKKIGVELKTIQDIVKHNKEIFNSLTDSNLNDRKTKLSAFIVALDDKNNSITKEVDEIISNYREKVKVDKAKNTERETSQELTESQKKNYIPWSEVESIYKKLKIEAEPLFKLEELNVAQFRKLQDFVLLSLYVLIDPRRSLDYTAFKIKNVDKEKDNYLLKKGKKSYFVFNQYKNSSRLGAQQIDIPNSLRNIIVKWTEKNPFDYLLVNSLGKPIGQSKLNEYLNQIFKKKIGSSMLRHIYLTHKYGEVNLGDLKETTENMGSSNIDRTLSYVSKAHGKK
jgi:hypothetical protein